MATVNETTGIAGTSRSQFINLLKDDYFPDFNKWIHVGCVAPSLVAKRRGQMGGKKQVQAAVTGLPQSSGVARGEGWKLPTPRGTTAVNPEIISRHLYYRLRWTGQVESAARKGKSVAWVAPRKLDMECAREQFELNFCRMLYMGPFDTLAQVKSHSVVNSVSVLTLYGRNDRTSAAASFSKFGAHYLRQNQSIQMVDSLVGMGGSPAYASTLGTASEAIINAAPDDSDPDNPSVTLDLDLTQAPASFTPADGDWLIPYASRRDSVNGTATTAISDYFGINGLNNIAIDDSIYSALFGLSKSTNPGLTALYLENGGEQRAFSERHIELMVTRAREKSGSVITKILCHDASLREVTKENRGDRRFEPVITSGGYGKLGVMFGDIKAPYEVDWLAPPGIFYGINPEHFGWYEESPLDSIDDQDRFVPDYDSHEIVARKSGNIECERPFAQAAADDFAFDAYELVA